VRLHKSEVKIPGKVEAHYYSQCGSEYMMSIMPEEIKVIENEAVEYILTLNGEGKVIVQKRLTGQYLRTTNWFDRSFWAILDSATSPPKLKKRMRKICEKWAGAAYDY